MKNETNKNDNMERLEEILNELAELGNEASELIHELSPRLASQGEAYGAFDLGSSSNQYDTTLSSIVMKLQDKECS